MEINDWARINIKKHRKLIKMTQKDFADCLHVKHSTVSLWESGKNAINLSRLDQICQLLNLTVEELIFDGKEFPIPLYSEKDEEKDPLIETMKKRPEIKELYKVSIDCKARDVIAVTNVLHDLG